jgi:hypothetical protein
MLTRQGAGLGFYPSDAERELAGEGIVVAAWRVDEVTTGTRSLTLETVGPLGLGDAIAHNVFQAAAGTWEQFFAIDVVEAPEAAACTAALSVPGCDAETAASLP